MTDAGVRSQLPAFFARAADACKDAVTAHLENHPSDLHFERHVLLALATLAASGDLPEPADEDLILIRSVCDDAAAACRTEEPNDPLIAVTRCLQETGDLCDQALGKPQKKRWQRFLFKDCDIDVIRLQRGWRIRNGTLEARNTLLDVTLEDVLSLPSHRIGELTVQILAWHSHDPDFPD